MPFRINQKKAIEKTIENKFKSGVYVHATGTGKSVISLEILIRFNELYPTKNVLWLCEQKTILTEQFKLKSLNDKGYKHIYNNFLIINYTNNKSTTWYDNINSASFWRKPILIIINRAFLVSNLKYKKIEIPIDLVIHDECHSISNNTTKEFYDYVLDKYPNIKCLGFSATPYLKLKPYDNVISKYTIIDAINDDVEIGRAHV